VSTIFCGLLHDSLSTNNQSAFEGATFDARCYDMTLTFSPNLKPNPNPWERVHLGPSWLEDELTATPDNNANNEGHIHSPIRHVLLRVIKITLVFRHLLLCIVYNFWCNRIIKFSRCILSEWKVTSLAHSACKPTCRVKGEGIRWVRYVQYVMAWVLMLYMQQSTE